MLYEVITIDGTVCYSSDQTGPKTIVIGKGGAEVGVTEGLRLLNKGDVASLILPPHLAHDLIGRITSYNVCYTKLLRCFFCSSSYYGW